MTFEPLKFSNVVGETLVKEPGQINGQQFSISRCISSVLVLLDHSATITIDDCTNCIIVTGPCKGSVFVRNCKNCLLFIICQQFRSESCQGIVVHLFCATAPTIEETNVEITPLQLDYHEIKEHMHSAGLCPFTNQWEQVQNFTPESGQFNLEPSSNLSDKSIVTAEVLEQFHSLLADHAPSVVNPHGLSIGPKE